MKLLVIVLCLLSERYLVHASSNYRFKWFESYSKKMLRYLPHSGVWQNQWMILLFLILPVIVASMIILYATHSILFGFAGLVLNVIIFYYCLGPKNPYYPTREDANSEVSSEEVGIYLSDVNGQLFAVIFWYIITGSIGIIFYRLVSLLKSFEKTADSADRLSAVLDWLPARMTCLLYLIVGNFQAGFKHFTPLFFSSPDKNEFMLTTCALHSVDYDQEGQVHFSSAETLVEHATLALLVIIALLTMVTWL